MAETLKDEQAESNFRHPDGRKLKSASEQAAILVQCFPGLNISRVEELAARYTVPPPGMEGLATIPKISIIAARFPPNERLTSPIPDWWPAYNRATVQLLVAMEKARGYLHWHAHIEPLDLSLTLRTAEAYAKFEAETLGDVMVFPVQTGILHRCMEVRRGPVTFQGCEFGLDAFAVGCIILTHLEWLREYENLAIDCIGSNYNAHPCAYPGRVLAWYYEFCLQFGDDRFDDALQFYGLAPSVLTE